MQCEVCGNELAKSGSLAAVLCPSEVDDRGFSLGSLCVESYFWQEKLRWAEAGDTTEEGYPCARIGGMHYLIMPRWEVRPFSNDRRWLGFGGREHTARFTTGPHAGKILSTNNCWCQGVIPHRFSDQLTDNAEWVKALPTERNALMRKGITLIEVLVVAALIAVLAIILTSVFTAARKHELKGAVSSRPAWMLGLSPRARLISALGGDGLDALDDRK